MNWQKVICDLEESGMTQVEIGKAVGCSQPYISDLKAGRRGRRVSFDVGSRLQRLWEKKRKKKA